MLSLLKIDGAELPEVATYKVTLSDADGSNSGRSETAVMNRDRVRANIAKIELSWQNVKTEDMKKIITAVTPEEFTVDFFFGTMRQAEMYAGDKTIDLKVANNDGSTAIWDVNVNLIEY